MPTPKFKPKTYLQLADHCYTPQAPIPEGWEIVTTSDQAFPPTINIHGNFVLSLNEIFGYFGVLYRHIETGNMVIADRGTANLENGMSDIQLLLRQIPFAHECAASFFDYVKKAYPSINLEVTGHSYGGADAQLTGAYHPETMVVTFEAPGVKECLPKHLRQQTFKNIINYVMPPNVVNQCNTRLGETIQLKPSKADEEAYKNFKQETAFKLDMLGPVADNHIDDPFKFHSTKYILNAFAESGDRIYPSSQVGNITKPGYQVSIDQKFVDSFMKSAGLEFEHKVANQYFKDVCKEIANEKTSDRLESATPKIENMLLNLNSSSIQGDISKSSFFPSHDSQKTISTHLELKVPNFLPETPFVNTAANTFLAEKSVLLYQVSNDRKSAPLNNVFKKFEISSSNPENFQPKYDRDYFVNHPVYSQVNSDKQTNNDKPLEPVLSFKYEFDDWRKGAAVFGGMVAGAVLIYYTVQGVKNYIIERREWNNLPEKEKYLRSLQNEANALDRVETGNYEWTDYLRPQDWTDTRGELRGKHFKNIIESMKKHDDPRAADAFRYIWRSDPRFLSKMIRESKPEDIGKKVIELQDQRFSKNVDLAYQKLKVGDTSEAKGVVSRMLGDAKGNHADDKHNPIAYDLRSKILAIEGDADGAIKSAQIAIDKATTEIGKKHYQKQYYSQCLRCGKTDDTQFKQWDEELKKTGGDSFWLDNAKIYESKGNLEAAKEVYTKILNNKNSIRDHRYQSAMELAKFAQNKNSTEEMYEYLKQAVAVSPSEQNGHFCLAQASLQLGKFEEAENHFKRVCDYKPNPSDPKKLQYESLKMLALIQEQTKNFESAKKYLTQAKEHLIQSLKDNDNDQALLLELAQINYRLKDFKTVEETLKSLVKRDDVTGITKANAYEILSKVFQHNGQLKEAAEQLALANQCDSDDLERLKSEAYLNLSINEYKKADKLFSDCSAKLTKKISQITSSETFDEEGKKEVQKYQKEIRQMTTINKLGTFQGALSKLDKQKNELSSEARDELFKQAYQAAKSLREGNITEEEFLELGLVSEKSSKKAGQKEINEENSELYQFKKQMENFVSSYELVDGSYLLSENVNQLSFLAHNEEHNKAYKLAKEIKEKYKKNNKVQEICDQAIAGKYSRDAVMIYGPLVRIVNHVISDQAARFGHNRLRKIVLVSSISNAILPNLQSDMVMMSVAYVRGDASVVKGNVLVNLEKQWKKYKSPITAVSALRAKGFKDSAKYIKSNKLKLLGKTTDLVSSVGSTTAVLMSHTKFGKKHQEAVSNLATGSQLVGTASTFFKTAKYIRTIKKGEAVVGAAKVANAGKKLASLSTALFDIAASGAFNGFEFMCSKVNLPEKPEDYTLTDHFKEFMSRFQLFPGHLPESEGYYYGKDWTKTTVGAVSSVVIPNPVSIGYTAVQGTLTFYNLFSGFYEECALQAIMANALYYWKELKYDEAKKSLKKIWKNCRNYLYKEEDSPIVKQAKIFDMEFKCAEAMRNNNFELVILLTQYKKVNDKYIFKTTHVPLIKAPHRILLFRLNSLARINQDNGFKDCRRIYKDFNRFYNIYLLDKDIDEDKKKSITADFKEIAIAIRNIHIFSIYKLANTRSQDEMKNLLAQFNKCRFTYVTNMESLLEPLYLFYLGSIHSMVGKPLECVRIFAKIAIKDRICLHWTSLAEAITTVQENSTNVRVQQKILAMKLCCYQKALEELHEKKSLYLSEEAQENLIKDLTDKTQRITQAIRDKNEQLKDYDDSWLPVLVETQRSTKEDKHRFFSRRHTFLHYTNAKTVHLAGSFNSWLNVENGLINIDEVSDEYKMHECEVNTWELSVFLPPGDHDFMYAINGGERWENDINMKYSQPKGGYKISRLNLTEDEPDELLEFSQESTFQM